MMEVNMTEPDRKSIASLRAQNAELLASSNTDDVAWTLPGASAVSGVAAGVAGTMKRAEGLAAHAVDLETLHVLYGLEDVAIMLRNTSRRGDRVLDEYLTRVCLLRGSRIHRLITYISDLPMMNAFFA
jgi:uncharacterized protein